jgi:hypothetical protein
MIFRHNQPVAVESRLKNDNVIHPWRSFGGILYIVACGAKRSHKGACDARVRQQAHLFGCK